MKQVLLFLIAILFLSVGVNAQQVVFTPTCAGNLTADSASYQSIITAAAGANRTIKVPHKADSSKRCSVNITIPANITLDFTDGGVMSVNSGQTLTLQTKSIVAEPTQQIFIASNTNTGSAGTGKVSFTGGTPNLSVMWWGAKGDGTTDDTNAVKAALASLDTIITGEDPLIRKRGGVLEFPVPPVYYRLTSTIDVRRPVHIRGVGTSSGGAQGTVSLQWDTPTVGFRFHRYNTSPGFTGTASDGSILEGFDLVGTVSTATGTANVTGLTVTRATGPNYNEDFASGYTITINSFDYVVQTVTDANTLIVYKPRLRVGVTNGSPTVTLPVSYTPTLPASWVGRDIKIDGVTYTIDSNTSSVITLTANYTGATASAVDAQVQSFAPLFGATTTLNKYHGVDIYSQMVVRDLVIRSWSGNGINIDTSTTPSGTSANDTNVNNSRVQRVHSVHNIGNGILLRGTNSNNIVIENFNGEDNRGAGIMDRGFLGSSFIASHLDANRFAPYFSDADLAYSTISGLYSEEGQPTNVGSQTGIHLGGDQGQGWTRPNMGYFYPGAGLNGDSYGYMRATPLRIIRQLGDSDGTTPLQSTSMYLGEMVSAYSSFFGVGAGNDTASLAGGSFPSTTPGPAVRFGYCQAGSALGTGNFSFSYDDPACTDLSKQLLTFTGSAASEGSAKVGFPSGIKYIGGSKDVGLQRTATNTLTLTDGSSGLGSLITGTHTVNPTGGSTNELRFSEIAANGSNYVGFKAPTLLAGNPVWTLPSADGTNGQILQTNGSGVLSWSANSASGMANPTTTTGDVIFSSTTGTPGTPSRLGIGTAGQCLIVTAGVPAWGSCAGGAAAAGTDTQVQFNTTGSFGADAGLTWNNTTKAVTLSSDLASTTISGLVLNQFNTVTGSRLMMRSARGSAAIPSALQANDLIGTITARGYGTTAFGSNSVAGINFNAAENFTDSAQGTYMAFSTSLIGSATRVERLRISDTGNVGVVKTFTVGEHSAFGSGATVDQIVGATGVGPTLVNIRETLTTFPGPMTKAHGMLALYTLNPNNAMISTMEIHGGQGVLEIPSPNAQAFSGELMGLTGTVTYAGTNSLNIMNGVWGDVQDNGTGTIAEMRGVTGQARTFTVGGTVSLAYGGFFKVLNSGPANNVTSARGMTANLSNTGSGTITNASTIQASTPVNSGGGAITSLIGVDIRDHSGVGAATHYNLWSRGANSQHLLEGSLTINKGITTPANHQFFEASSGVIHRLNDRVFVGGATDMLPSAGTVDWAEAARCYKNPTGSGVPFTGNVTTTTANNTVTFVSGDNWALYYPCLKGMTINIPSSGNYTIASVTDSTHLVTTANAGNHTNVAYTIGVGLLQSGSTAQLSVLSDLTQASSQNGFYSAYSSANGSAVGYGMAAVAYNNSTVSGDSIVWGLYIESHRKNSIVGETTGAEIEVVNMGDEAPHADPYGAFDNRWVEALQLGCGGGLPSTGLAKCTNFMEMFPNPMQAKGGLKIANGAISASAPGSTVMAIGVPTLYEFQGYKSAGVLNYRLYSDTNDLLQLWGLKGIQSTASAPQFSLKSTIANGTTGYFGSTSGFVGLSNNYDFVGALSPTISDATRMTASFSLQASTTDSNIYFSTTDTINTAPEIRVTIGKSGGIKLSPSTRPTCAAGIRGTLWYVAGTPDSFAICALKSDFSYAWIAWGTAIP